MNERCYLALDNSRAKMHELPYWRNGGDNNGRSNKSWNILSGRLPSTTISSLEKNEQVIRQHWSLTGSQHMAWQRRSEENVQIFLWTKHSSTTWRTVVGVYGMNLTFAHKYIGVLGDNNELECQKRASLSDAVTAKLRDYVIDGKCMIEQYMYHRG